MDSPIGPEMLISNCENFQIFHDEKIYLFQGNNPGIRRGEGKLGMDLEL